jgi:hypothetical protein
MHARDTYRPAREVMTTTSKTSRPRVDILGRYGDDSARHTPGGIHQSGFGRVHVPSGSAARVGHCRAAARRTRTDEGDTRQERGRNFRVVRRGTSRRPRADGRHPAGRGGAHLCELHAVLEPSILRLHQRQRQSGGSRRRAARGVRQSDLRQSGSSLKRPQKSSVVSSSGWQSSSDTDPTSAGVC